MGNVSNVNLFPAGVALASQARRLLLHELSGNGRHTWGRDGPVHQPMNHWFLHAGLGLNIGNKAIFMHN